MLWHDHPGLLADIETCGDVSATVRLAGEIDLTCAQTVRDAVTRASSAASRVVLDLSQVTFCDVAGARVLLMARERAKAMGTELIVRHPGWHVRRVLDLTGVLPLICANGAGAAVPTPGIDPDVAAICRTALTEAVRLSGADMGTVQVLDPGSGALRLAAQRGFEQPFLDFFGTVADRDCACGTALADARPVWVADVASSQVFAGMPAREIVLGAGCRAVASVPVLAEDGGVIAMISTHHRRRMSWDEQRKGRLEVLAAGTGWLLSA